MAGYYNTVNRENFVPGTALPLISKQLDSVRTYQFEVRFAGLPPEVAGNADQLTLAAKQVSPIAGSIDDIVVDRVNDKVYYPGKFTPDPVTITFDNQYLTQASPTLWKWFKSIYDPITGDATTLAAPGGPGNRTFKANKLTIVELDNHQEPHATIELYGVYPQSVRFSEKVYSDASFSTMEVTFRYDFVDYAKSSAT